MIETNTVVPFLNDAAFIRGRRLFYLFHSKMLRLLEGGN